MRTLLIGLTVLVAVGCGGRRSDDAEEPTDPRDEPDGDEAPPRDEVDDDQPDEVEPPTCAEIGQGYFDALVACDLLDEAPAAGEVEAACAEATVLAACIDEVGAFTACRTDCEGWAADCTTEYGALIRCSNYASATCDLGFEGVCDEPGGTDVCPAGTDALDCAPASQEAGSDGPGMAASCDSANDGVCDEPEGTNLCMDGTDTDDCDGGGAGQEAGSDGPGMAASCDYTNDGECDEPEGTGLCMDGTDPDDCAYVEPEPACDPAACQDEQIYCDEYGCLVCSYWCEDDACTQHCNF